MRFYTEMVNLKKEKNLDMKYNKLSGIYKIKGSKGEFEIDERLYTNFTKMKEEIEKRL